MKPIKARITAFHQQCSSNYRNHSCIFMLEFNNNLFYCLNGMRLVHSSITHLYNTSSLILMCPWIISNFAVTDWGWYILVLEIVPVLMTYWQTIQNKARRFFFTPIAHFKFYKTWISIMNFINFIFYPICSYSIFIFFYFLVCLELEQF